MKEIYEMVQDGTSDMFIDAYKNAIITKALGFTYNYRFYDVIKAKAVVNLIQQAQKEYNTHIDTQAKNEQNGQWLNQ